LLGGACFLVDNAKNLALKFNVRPLIIAVTIVAFGTSSPELLVSLVSALKVEGGMALGTVVGSNIANIALVLGFACITKPVSAEKSLKFVDIPVMIIFGLALFAFSRNGFISRPEGLILLLGLCGYFCYCIKTGKEKEENSAPEPSKSKTWYFAGTIIGLITIIVGAKLLVNGGVALAEKFELSKTFIAVSVFAIGSSLPELATSVVASYKNQHEISFGNVVGSNIQNIALVIGIVALIKPLSCELGELNASFVVMLAFSFLLYAIILIAGKLNRVFGLLFVLAYFAYLWFSYKSSLI